MWKQGKFTGISIRAMLYDEMITDHANDEDLRSYFGHPNIGS